MKLKKRFKILFHTIASFLFLTGTGTWALQSFVRVPGVFGEDHHPIEPWLLHAHGIGAYAFVAAFGYLLRDHVQPCLQGNRRRFSGLLFLGVICTLTITVFPILYSADGSLRVWAKEVHIDLGLAAPFLFVLHSRSFLAKLQFKRNSKQLLGLR